MQMTLRLHSNSTQLLDYSTGKSWVNDHQPSETCSSIILWISGGCPRQGKCWVPFLLCTDQMEISMTPHPPSPGCTPVICPTPIGPLGWGIWSGREGFWRIWEIFLILVFKHEFCSIRLSLNVDILQKQSEGIVVHMYVVHFVVFMLGYFIFISKL